MATYTTQIDTGVVPGEPYLLVGQMTTTDPSRSPAGTESLWMYTHVPQRVRGDAGDDGLTGRWDASEAERFADRMQARMEAYGARVRLPRASPADPHAARAGAS